MGKFVDLTGQRFGRLIVVERAKNKGTSAMWLCKCDCGNETIVETHRLNSSHTKSCGCLQKEIIRTLGFKNLYKEGQMQNKDYQRIRKILNLMRARCYNIKNNRYKNYGARGIKICDEWSGKEGIKNFYKWAMENGYKNNLSIDRIDNNGNYEPNNCRWISNREQANNRTTNNFITYKNETHTIAEWSRILNMNYSKLQTKLARHNWVIEECFFTDKRKKGKKVLQYDLKGNLLNSYDSLRQTIAIYKNKHIADCCRNKRKTAGGYIWRYADEVKS